MNIQDWFPLGLVGLIFLLSNGLSRVFSSTTVQRHQFFVALLFLWSSFHNCTSHWKDHSLDYIKLSKGLYCAAKVTVIEFWVINWWFLIGKIIHSLSDPMDCSPPGSSVHGNFLARILDCVAISLSRGSFWPRDWTHVSCVSAVASGFFTTVPHGKPSLTLSMS